MTLSISFGPIGAVCMFIGTLGSLDNLGSLIVVSVLTITGMQAYA